MAEDRNILAFGDSVAMGCCDSEHGGWIGRLASLVESKTDWCTLVYNLGVSGDTSEDVLRRIEFECQGNRKPHMIIISVGANDSGYIKKPERLWVKPEKYRENLSRILEIAGTLAERVLFLGDTLIDESKSMPVSWDQNLYYTNGNIRKYGEIAKEVCREKAVPFLDLSGVFKPTEGFLYDGVHPNTKGHERMFQAVRKFLEEKKWI